MPFRFRFQGRRRRLAWFGLVLTACMVLVCLVCESVSCIVYRSLLAEFCAICATSLVRRMGNKCGSFLPAG